MTHNYDYSYYNVKDFSNAIFPTGKNPLNMFKKIITTKMTEKETN